MVSRRVKCRYVLKAQLAKATLYDESRTCQDNLWIFTLGRIFRNFSREPAGKVGSRQKVGIAVEGMRGRGVVV